MPKLLKKSAFIIFAAWTVNVSAQETNNSAPVSVHKLALFFTSNGWFNCAERANQIASVVGSGRSDEVFMVNRPAPNTSLINVTLLNAAEDQYSVTEMSFVVAQPTCPASYTLTQVFQDSCENYLDSLDDRESFSAIGGSENYVSQPTKWATVRLSPITSGCLRVQTEVVEN